MATNHSAARAFAAAAASTMVCIPKEMGAIPWYTDTCLDKETLCYVHDTSTELLVQTFEIRDSRFEIDFIESAIVQAIYAYTYIM